MAEQLSTRQTPNQAQGTGRYTTSSNRSLESNMHALPKQEIVETVYVLRNQPMSLLGKAACVSLKIISRVDEISGSRSLATPNFGAEFPKLFTRLGKLNTDYRITLQPGAIPFCRTTARKVPHSLLQKVKKELDSMLEQGVISPVTVPTEWCSGMVPVLTPDGRVRICVDLTKLNQGSSCTSRDTPHDV